MIIPIKKITGTDMDNIAIPANPSPAILVTTRLINQDKARDITNIVNPQINSFTWVDLSLL